MQKGIAVVLGLLLSVFVATHTDAHGWRGGRSSHFGHWRAGHATTGVGVARHHPFGRHRFGHFHRLLPLHRHPFGFSFSPKFAHRHLHFSSTPFFVRDPYFPAGGFAFHSFGIPFGFGVRTLSTFSSTGSFGAAGFPPFGAGGPSPLGGTGPPPVVISSPFFCFPHRLSFTEEAPFIDHLHRFHRLPPHRALSFCRPVGGVRLIFFGF